MWVTRQMAGSSACQSLCWKLSDETLRELISKFFLSPFSDPEFDSFTFKNEDFTLNPLCKFASQMFSESDTFHGNSVNIARHLYELSVHPQIKSGDLFIAHISDMHVDGELTNALGIIKSENRQAFLKLDNTGDDFSIRRDDGINIEKLDKGCLIFDINKTLDIRYVPLISQINLQRLNFGKTSFFRFRHAVMIIIKQRSS